MIYLEREIDVSGLVSAFRYTFPNDFCYDGEKHEGWEFVFVDSGKIMVQANEKKYIIKSGELVCHKPMEFHTLSPYHSNATAIIFCFHCSSEKMRFFENKILSVNQRQRIYLNDIVAHAESFLVSKEPLEIVRDGFMSKSQYGSSINAQFIKNTIELLILSLYSSQSTEIQVRTNSYSQLVKRKKLTEDIKEYLKRNLGKAVSLSQIAAEFSYSLSTIKTVFKEETGIGVIEYYNHLRLETAKRLLADKNSTIGEIAESLGFHTSSHFSNFFKKATGSTPQKYRESPF